MIYWAKTLYCKSGFYFPCLHCTFLVQFWNCFAHVSRMSRNISILTNFSKYLSVLPTRLPFRSILFELLVHHPCKGSIFPCAWFTQIEMSTLLFLWCIFRPADSLKKCSPLPDWRNCHPLDSTPPLAELTKGIFKERLTGVLMPNHLNFECHHVFLIYAFCTLSNIGFFYLVSLSTNRRAITTIFLDVTKEFACASYEHKQNNAPRVSISAPLTVTVLALS